MDSWHLIVLYVLEHVIVYWGGTLGILCWHKQLHKGRAQISVSQVLRVLRNQCLLVFPLLAWKSTTVAAKHCTLNILVYQFVISAILQSVLFYFIHRLFHINSFLFNNFHALHHQHRVTWPWQAIDCTMTEHLACNLAPVLIGPWFVQMPHTALRLWGTLATLNTIWSHSGQVRSGAEHKRRPHDIHHSHLRYNFGTGTTLDRLFGTYKSE